MAREILCKLAAWDLIQDPELRYPYFRCTQCGKLANFDVACLVVQDDDGTHKEAIGACCVEKYLRALYGDGSQQ